MFMVFWVRRFFEYRIKLPKMSWAEQIPLFIQELNESGFYQGWQADQAVRFPQWRMIMPAHQG